MNEGTMIVGFLHIISGLIFIAISIPLIQGSVKMNSFYGVRIKKAFESERNWYELNKYGGKRLVFWSIVLICIGILSFFIKFDENSMLFVVFSCAPVLVLIPLLIEIYIFSKKL